jgi:Protein of unknown function (DUF3105)
VEAEHPRARRAAGVIATAVVALAGGIALLLFFVARDDAPVDKGADAPTAVKGPGQAFTDLGDEHVSPPEAGKAKYNSDPPTSGPHVPEAIPRDEVKLTDDQILHALEQGNVVLVYGKRKAPKPLRRLAQDVSGGPFDPSLVGAGQSVILARRKGTHGVVALAWTHLLRVSTADDPELARFAEFWLGRGAPR